jgi:ABC-type uncharacterized transport system ATPase subunit
MIAAEDLKKYYGHVHAVDRISFSVAEGEVFGFLGHNGAGFGEACCQVRSSVSFSWAIEMFDWTSSEL